MRTQLNMSHGFKMQKIFGSEEPPLCSSLSSLCRGNANLLCIVPIFLMPTRRWQQYIHLVNVQFPLLRITEVKLERPAPSQLFFFSNHFFFLLPSSFSNGNNYYQSRLQATIVLACLLCKHADQSKIRKKCTSNNHALFLVIM